MALDNKDQKPAAPKSQFMQMLLLILIVFLMYDARLRTTLGNIAGVVLKPTIGFGGRLPILTILVAALIMIGWSTLLRHWLVDWVKMARIQNTMRAFQKAQREARANKDTKRIEQLSKFQTKLMGMQAELSTGQFKPMAGTMIVVVPVFAWLLQFVQQNPYHFFTAPWNPAVGMFTTEGILPPSGTSLLPHWILFYSAISMPFGTLLQRGLKYFTWREHWHLIGPGGKPTPEAVKQ